VSFLRRRLRQRSQRGAAALEFALIVVPMLYLVFGGISYAYMFSFRQALSQSASEAARAAIGADPSVACNTAVPFSATNCQAQYAASQAVANALSSYGMSCGTSSLTCTFAVGTSAVVSTCPTSHTCIRVVVTYPYRDHSLLPAVPGFGLVLPSSLSFSSVVQLT
jgi:Flp pilus assembly protein TadG